MQVVVDSLLTHYQAEGSGRVMVLLHGWGDSAAGLGGLQKALAKQYKVIALDLPGFGGTEAPHEVWGLDNYAEFVKDFLKKVDSGPVTVLAGHSNGGAIAVRGLAKGTLQADRLVLIASAGIRGVYKGRVRALRYITKAGKALTMPLPKGVKQKLRQKVYTSVGSDMLVAEHLQETFKRVVTDDVRQDAASLTIPTLLIYGEQDQATPVQYGETFHELIDGSELQILPGAGHFVHIDRPETVVKAIEGFAA
ncbi:MAG TPA: alpha/beta hydrolase [Patescibacteria group bacterium]|nr:alpha/beta hydrolase [Patescibacteria group bacterium]